MTRPLEEVPFSELIQHPTRTTGRLAEVRALRLRRRDADDLVLMAAGRVAQEGEVIDITARLLAGVLEEAGAQVVRRALPAALPWVRFLPAEAVDALLTEFVETARAAAQVSNVAPIALLLAAWRHTAEVYSDPELYALLTRAHEGDHGSVPVPR